MGGQSYRYDIVPILDPDVIEPDARTWSLLVHVPQDNVPLSEQVGDMALRSQSVAAITTTLSWVTFIPQKRVDCPGKSFCEYGTDYQFGGDGHDLDWSSDRFRTAVHAIITWKDKSVKSHPAIGTTRVYEKKTGKLVAQRTASKSGLSARKLASPGKTLDIRIENRGGNPFCKFGAIDGAFTMGLMQTGNWIITSGEHRRMPNHYIYIFNDAKVTELYRKKYENAACLIGPMLCGVAQLGGLQGKFRL